MLFKHLFIFPFLISNLVYAEASLDSFPSSHQKNSNKPVTITIIMDDIGAKASDAKAFQLPSSVTFAILPHTDFSTDFSYWASSQNREVMLHMPMESLHKDNLGPGPILASMYPNEVKNALTEALKTVPHAVGVNNHMGSKLTQMTLQMNSLMHTLQRYNLFFIDSRTTRFTKAKAIARANGVKSASRHIFLDHEQSDAFLESQFNKLLGTAEREGKAIGIGHPYSVTIQFLKRKLANMPANVTLIPVSEYLQETNKFRVNPQLAHQHLQPKSLPRVNRALSDIAPE